MPRTARNTASANAPHTLALRLAGCLLGCLLSLPMPAQLAATDNPQPLAQLSYALRKAGENTHDITATYNLTRHQALLANDATETGDFRYQVSPPSLTLNARDGGQVRIDSNGLTVNGQAAPHGAATTALLDIVKASVTGDFTALTRRGQLVCTATDRTWLCRFAPSDRRILRYITGITLEFDRSSARLLTLLIEQPGGDSMRYDFSRAGR